MKRNTKISFALACHLHPATSQKWTNILYVTEISEWKPLLYSNNKGTSWRRSKVENQPKEVKNQAMEENRTDGPLFSTSVFPPVLQLSQYQLLLCFLLLSFLHVFSGLCILSAKRLCNFSTVCDVLCLFPHLVSKERMCFFPPLYHPPFPHSEKKDACLSAQLSKLPNKIKDLQYFYVYIRPSMTASLSKAIFECETSQTTICRLFFFFDSLSWHFVSFCTVVYWHLLITLTIQRQTGLRNPTSTNSD